MIARIFLVVTFSILLCVVAASSNNHYHRNTNNNINRSIIQANDVTVLKPPSSRPSSSPQKLLVLLQGAFVPSSYYINTSIAIQDQTTNAALWVAIPTFTGNLPDPLTAANVVDEAIHAAIASGFPLSSSSSSSSFADVFVGGHSLGSVCAFNVAVSNRSFAAVVLLSGYVDINGQNSLENLTTNFMMLSGELDGLTRPSFVSPYVAQLADYVNQHGGYDNTLPKKMVGVIYGLDHSDMCPGYFVKGDLPSELSQDQATAAVGEAVGAFLNLQVQPSDSQSLGTLQTLVESTETLLIPFVKLQSYETNDWCVSCQRYLSGLSSGDSGRLQVTNDYQFSGISFPFAHTTYQLSADNHTLDVSTVSHNKYDQFLHISSFPVSAEEIACKCISSDRVASELNVTIANPNTTCREMNAASIQLATTSVLPRTLQRYLSRGIPIVLQDDVSESTGFTWVSSALGFQVNSTGAYVSSPTLYSPLNSPIYPGNHYCKLLSPARVAEWMMLDSLFKH